MEISLLAILLSIAALGLNVMLIAFWSENKKKISSVNRHLENEIKWQEKDNEQKYVKSVHYENAIRDFKINILQLGKDIENLKEESYKKETGNKYYVVKTSEGYWYGVTDDYTDLERSKKFNSEYYSREYVEELMSEKLGNFCIPHVIQLLEITHEIIDE